MILDIFRITKSRPDDCRIAIHIHIHYFEVLTKILDYLLNFREAGKNIDLFVTTSSAEVSIIIKEAIKNHSVYKLIDKLFVQVCINRGRNIMPLLIELWPSIKDYCLLLHVHSKKSVDTSFGEKWLDDLLNSLLESPDEVNKIINLFIVKKDLGLLIPRAAKVIRPYLNWGCNFKRAQKEFAKLGYASELEVDNALIFPAGMMFWARPGALEPIARISSENIDEFDEPLSRDGNILHTIERLVVHSCEATGFQWNIVHPKEEISIERRQDSKNTFHISDRLTNSYEVACATIADKLRENIALLDESRENFKRCQSQLSRTVRNADEQLREASTTITIMNQDIQNIKSSLTWKITKPLRFIEKKVKVLINLLKK